MSYIVFPTSNSFNPSTSIDTSLKISSYTGLLWSIVGVFDLRASAADIPNPS